MTEMHERALEIEAELLSEGWDAEDIPLLLGAAMCASLLNLPIHRRSAQLSAHFTSLFALIQGGLLAGEGCGDSGRPN